MFVKVAIFIFTFMWVRLDYPAIQIRPVNEPGMERIDTVGADQYGHHRTGNIAERKWLEILINFEHAVTNKQGAAGREETNDLVGKALRMEYSQGDDYHPQAISS